MGKAVISASYTPIINDHKKCINIISIKKTKQISRELVQALIVAEDHRHELHYGIDPIAIARAVKLRLFNNIKQGASTIEQQLVRTITGRYEKTPRRKIREQLLAVMISREFTKEEICKAYLAIAYYGHNKQGDSGINKIKKGNQKIKNTEIISMLKYPAGEKSHIKISEKISKRSAHIEKLLSTRKLPILLSRRKTPQQKTKPLHIDQS